MTETRNRRRGPKRRYSPAVEAEQAKLAAQLVAQDATWSEMIVAFAARGWEISQTLLKLRIAEWGIRR